MSCRRGSSSDIRRRGAKALIGLVGVQSNQFHHALDLAREFRAAGLPVVIGGFHVSGCLSMLKEIPPEIQEALDIGCSLFAGEAEEGRLDALFVDAWAGRAPADLQLSQGPAEHRRRPRAVDAEGIARAQFGAMVELRSRPRLPVPVQLLHDHQRPGAQEPLPHRRRPRRDHPRESGAGDQGLLHHRRQSRPQPRLGGVLRPADQAAARRRGSRPTSPSRSTRSATASPISSTRRSAPG